MSGRKLTAEDWDALAFEAATLFTPSAPIGVAELFAGRQTQIRTLQNVIAEPGRHAIIYGEPGVGKTSLAQIIKYTIPVRKSEVILIRESAFSNDTFSSIWTRIFQKIPIDLEEGETSRRSNLSEIYPSGVNQGNVRQELELVFSLNQIPIIVIDEYNLIKDPNVSAEMAEIIKSLSDSSVRATVIIVGVSDSVSDLVRGHQSIIRCSEEVLMPRMTKDEMRVLLESRITKLGMKLDGNAKWKIINLAKGLPAFGHSLGRTAVNQALQARRLLITEDDVDEAIKVILKSSQNTLKDDYERATSSNQEKARFRHVLTACALAKSDESGYFFPKQIQAPLTSILGKSVDFADFHRMIREFTDEKRGGILQRKGEERPYRYRFRNPAMQPYVIMKGIADGHLDEKAKLALSSPEQPDLFPNE